MSNDIQFKCRLNNLFPKINTFFINIWCLSNKWLKDTDTDFKRDRVEMVTEEGYVKTTRDRRIIRKSFKMFKVQI